MTRVNVGILPSELCDQMLLAEIRELPRCFKYADDRGPTQFTLGTGHVLWCARHQLSLKHRLETLTFEAARRGFNVQPQSCLIFDGRIWRAEDLAIARPLLIARIRDRLTAMVRTPTWTHRQRPAWSL